MTQLHKATLALLALIVAGLALIWWRSAAPAVDDALHDSYYVVANVRHIATLAGPAILNLLLLLVLPMAKDGRGSWVVWSGALVHAVAVIVLGWMLVSVDLPRRYSDEIIGQMAALNRSGTVLYASMLVGLVMQFAGWLWLICARFRR